MTGAAKEQARAEFGVRDVLKETFAIIWTDRRRILAWGAWPLMLWMGLNAALEYQSALHLDSLSGILKHFLSYLIVVPFYGAFAVRVNRRVLLGDDPNNMFFSDLASSRTWNYLANNFVLTIKSGVLYIVLNIVPVVVGLILVKEGEGGVSLLVSRSLIFTLYVAMFIGAYAVLAPQLVLLLPDISADGDGGLRRMDRLGSYKRWTMVWVWMILTAAAMILIGICSSINEMWTNESTKIVFLLEYVVVQGVLYGVREISCAVMYKKISLLWPREQTPPALMPAPAVECLLPEEAACMGRCVGPQIHSTRAFRNRAGSRWR